MDPSGPGKGGLDFYVRVRKVLLDAQSAVLGIFSQVLSTALGMVRDACFLDLFLEATSSW